MDGDDGNPNDGICLKMTVPCESLFIGDGLTGITVELRYTPFGTPLYAGLVWTDGEGAVSFEAWDGRGMLIGTLGPFSGMGFTDSTVQNTTGEDRFFGAFFPYGISRIRVFNTQGSTEIDHIQYGN